MTDELNPVVPTEPVAPQEPTTPAPEPVEPTPDPAPAADPADDSGPSDPDPGATAADEPAAPKKKGGFQKRIEELTTEKYQERLEKEALRRENEELKRKLDPQPITERPVKPVLADFQTVDAFEAALGRYGDDVAAWSRQEARKEIEAERTQATEAERHIAVQAAIAAREDLVRRKYTDYDRTVDAVGGQLMADPVFRQYAEDGEAAGEVAYHLGKNPAALAHFAQLSPLNKVRELIKLEERLTAPPPAKPTTKAPDPITPVGSQGAGVKSFADLAAADDIGAYVAAKRAKAGKR